MKILLLTSLFILTFSCDAVFQGSNGSKRKFGGGGAENVEGNTSGQTGGSGTSDSTGGDSGFDSTGTDSGTSGTSDGTGTGSDGGTADGGTSDGGTADGGSAEPYTPAYYEEATFSKARYQFGSVDDYPSHLDTSIKIEVVGTNIVETIRPTDHVEWERDVEAPKLTSSKICADGLKVKWKVTITSGGQVYQTHKDSNLGGTLFYRHNNNKIYLGFEREAANQGGKMAIWHENDSIGLYISCSSSSHVTVHDGCFDQRLGGYDSKLRGHNAVKKTTYPGPNAIFADEMIYAYVDEWIARKGFEPLGAPYRQCE